MKKSILNKKVQGRKSYKEGYDFEEKVAELYRLLHYEVEHGRLFSGRQVDLFLTRRIGDLVIHRAVECKSGPVKVEHIDSFHAKLVLVRQEFPSTIGTIVSASTFTDAVTSHAAKIGLHIILFRDLSAQLFDGHSYVRNLLRELTSNERYPRELYIEPHIGYDTNSVSEHAFQVISEWQQNPEWKQLTILGDVGTGKSFLSKMVAYKLAEEFLKAPLDNPIPILIDLRNADRQFSLEGLILTHLAKNGLSQISFDIFQYALSQRQIVLILDGFDEMAARVTPQVTIRNFHELSRCVQGQAKVMLTCRTHYFKSRTEEEEVILGGSVENRSEMVRELYWDLISRKGFKIAYLRPFTVEQIEAYVKKVRPKSTRETMSKIHQIYNLMELSQRPMLLEMIVKSINKLKGSDINQATLYKVFTSAWIHRDQWRDVLSSEEKLNFLMGLAQRLWQEDVQAIHYGSLTECITNDLAARITNQQELVEIDNEIRTASFLTRDDAGFYGFAHKSYQEYFYAEFIAEQLGTNKFDCLYTRRMSPEVIGFLGHIINASDVEPVLEGILQENYRPMISENALIVLYGIRKNAILSKASAEKEIPLPSGCNLEGAQLEQVTLEGAIIKNGDFRKANLNEAVLTRADLSESDLTDANLTRTNLIQAKLNSSELRNSVFVEANLESSDISYSIIEGADFTDAHLIGIRYEGVNFSGVTLSRAILSKQLAELIQQTNYDQLKHVVNPDQSIQFELLWERIYKIRPFLIRQARRVGLDVGLDSEDIVSDSITTVMRQGNIQEISALPDDQLRAYLAKVVKHYSIDSLRRRSNIVSLNLSQDAGSQEDEVEHYELSIDDITIKELIDHATDHGLSPDQKLLLSEITEIVRTNLSSRAEQVFHLYFVEGMTYQEIAEELNISHVHVVRLLRNIRLLIREWLAK